MVLGNVGYSLLIFLNIYLKDLNTILKKVSVLNLLSTSSVMMTLYLGDLHDIMTTVLADHLATLPQNSAVQDEPRPKLLQSIDCHCCIAW